MKICIINEFFRPAIAGGIEYFFGLLSDYLISKGFEVDVITNRFRGEKEHERKGKLNIYRISSSPIYFKHIKQLPAVTLPFNFFNFSLKKKMRKIIGSCQVVHVNNLYHLSFAPLQVANELGKFVVLDIHDYWAVCIKRNPIFLNKRLCEEVNPGRCLKCVPSTNIFSRIFYPSLSSLVILEYLLRKKYLKFNELITHSKFVSNAAEKILGAKSIVINYPYLGREISKRKKRIDEQVNLLYMGRIEKEKGVYLLPQIAKILKEKKISYKINVLGQGSEIDKLKTITKKQELNIEFHGFIKHMSEKFINILKESHILLVPSLWYEPFGMVVQEAMAFGIPVIASNRGGLKDIVINNNVGIVTHPDAEVIAEKIELLVKDRKKYVRFSLNGFKNIKKYKLSDVLKRYGKIFEKGYD